MVIGKTGTLNQGNVSIYSGTVSHTGLIQESVNSTLKIDAERQSKAETLFNHIEESAQAIEQLPIFTIDTRLETDAVLETLIPVYRQSKTEYKELVRQVQQRMSAWSNQSGYLNDLLKILEQSQARISELNPLLCDLNQKIQQRLQLIAPQQVSQEGVTNARRELFQALDLFLLSFSVTQLHDKSQPEHALLLQQLSTFVLFLNECLSNKKMALNADAAEQLATLLRKHLGMRSTFERLFSSTTETKSLNAAQFNPILEHLFHNNEPTANEEDLREQLVRLSDLTARVSAFPIIKIKQYATLKASEQIQEQDLLQSQHKIHQQLQGYKNKLQAELKTFIQNSSKQSPEETRVHLALNNVESQISELRGAFADYQMKKEARYESPLKRLDEMTHQQELLLQKLAHMTACNQQLDVDVNASCKALHARYDALRQTAIRQMHDALHNAQSAAKECVEEDEFFDFTPYKEDLARLSDLELELSVNEMRTMIDKNSRRLNGLIDKVKNELKLKWGNELILLFKPKACVAINPNSSVHELTVLLNTELAPIDRIELNDDNPLQQSVDELTSDLNKRKNNALTHFAQLHNTAGNQLSTWRVRMSSELGFAEQSLSTYNRVVEKAELIENRLQNKAYKTSIRILATIESEFINIVTNSIDLALRRHGESDELIALKNNPASYLRHTKLGDDLRTLLDQTDLRLVILHAIYQAFSELNSSYINLNTHLLNTENYVSQLFDITMSHLHNNSMEELSKDSSKRSQLIFWLRVYVLKPLVQYKELAKEYIDPYLVSIAGADKREDFALARPRLFTPVKRTPLASSTEDSLIRVGHHALNELELEYRDMLGISAA